jgi:DNA end-binding protein Ku
MAARSLWKGFLRINLVSVPVKAYSSSASGGAEVRLNQLHAACNSRIRYKKTCPLHGEVPNDEIVSGYEYTKDRYVVIDSDEVERFRSADEKAIQVNSFVPLDKIDPLFLAGKNYYLVPDGPVGQKAYQVIYQGLMESERGAAARVVMHGKDQYVFLRPFGGLLVMATLHYADQVTLPSAFAGEVVQANVEAEELQLIQMLIKASSKPELDVASCKDHYAEKLMQVIDAKITGKELVMPASEEPAQVINLMEALRRSVEQAQGKDATKAKPTTKEKPPRKMAARQVA